MARGEPVRFIVGIDLGTTNCAVAMLDTASGDPHSKVFPVPQIIAPGEIASRETLPSFRYEAGRGEFAPDALRLPWTAPDDPGPEATVGVFARDHGTAVPGRLIASAKSWLCHSGVDRTAKLLPWQGAPDVQKLSPSEASASYLAHIHAAWNHSHPEHPLETQDVVLTIPASFDEIARELTVAAARRAGLSRVTLLEEPQAAFYAWIDSGRERISELRPGQQVLVCDIGGGTSDFTLIEVRLDPGGRVNFHRVAVGDHLILGGDNLDLALAHTVEDRLGAQLDGSRWSVLVRRCRDAKEILLSENAPERLMLHVPGSGRRLIGEASQVELTREEVTALLVDGFLPFVGFDDKPQRRASGFQEFGLPYAPDSAITRYLAAFLTAHRAGVPDAVLFNGGLFESAVMRERLLEVMARWFGARPAVLHNARSTLAVAMGAAHYGMVRRGRGTRIHGGLARAYYVGIQIGERAAAVCLAPAGLEEGHDVELAREFELLVRQPAEFPLYASSVRTTDQPGDLVPVDPAELMALPPIRTALRSRETAGADTLRVRLRAHLTEIGTLELSCGEIGGARRWKLPFDVRAPVQSASEQPSASDSGAAAIFDSATVQRCREAIAEAFGNASSSEAVAGLVKRLEQIVGTGRFDWPPSLLRSLWEELMQWESARSHSVTHEARWLNLAGFALRPGHGFPVDDWRVAQTWRLFERKVVHRRNELCRAEWWIFWRRIAGGLSSGQQRVIAEPLLAELRKAGERGKSESLGAHELAEIWRLLASLELLDPALRVDLGERLITGIKAGDESGKRRMVPGLKVALWALGRLGARVPMLGFMHTVVPVAAAAHWLAELIDLDLGGDAVDGQSRTAPGRTRVADANDLRKEALLAAMLISRRTGDRYRDLDEETRGRILEWMERNAAPAHYLNLVREGGAVGEAEQSRIFGESLPHGLRLSE